MASTSKKIVAEALSRVVARNMLAGRSLPYERMLTETAAEVDVLLSRRRERDARLLRQARKRVLEAQVRLAAVAESRAASEAGRELAEFDMAPGVPAWHPEHSENDII